MQWCLNKEQISQLVDFDFATFELSDNPSELENLLYGCMNWDTELICLTYFLSQILEIKTRQGVQPSALIKNLHDFFVLQERVWLTFQEINTDFIDYLFRYTKDESLSLEESLIQAQNWLNEHKYI